MFKLFKKSSKKSSKTPTFQKPLDPSRRCVEVRDAAVTFVPCPVNTLVRQGSALTAPTARAGPLFQAFMDGTLSETPPVLAAQLNTLLSLEETRAQSMISQYALPLSPLSSISGSVQSVPRSRPASVASVAADVPPSTDSEEHDAMLEQLAALVVAGIAYADLDDFDRLADQALDELTSNLGFFNSHA